MSNISLLDLAIDLLNEVKAANDSKSKIFFLEQIREILIHRFNLQIYYFFSCV